MRHAACGTALSVTLLAILSVGCADTGGHSSGSQFDAVGFVHPPSATGGSSGPVETPNVDGVWRAGTTVTFSNCGSRVPSQEGTQVVELSQSDTILNAHIFSPCGAPIATGAGTINGSSMILSFTQD